MGHQVPGHARPYEPAPASAHRAQAMVEGALLLTRRRRQGASARDHEARTDRRCEPQGGVHQGPDGGVYKIFRYEQRHQFHLGTATVELQLGRKLWIDSDARAAGQQVR
jgi:hypothetical protein